MKPLSDAERGVIALVALAAYERSVARADRHEAELLDCMVGEHYGFCHCQRNHLDAWECAELARINEGRAEPLYSLPDSAYEARRLGRYAIGDRC